LLSRRPQAGVYTQKQAGVYSKKACTARDRVSELLALEQSEYFQTRN
jgi:hypothetical protein